MRKLIPLSAIAAAALLFGGVAANAQQKDTPAKAQGAGAECSRMTDAKMRDDCVRHARDKDKDKATKDTTRKGGGEMKHEAPAKGKKS